MGPIDPSQNSAMPLLDHLRELRNRLMWVAAFFIAVFFAAFNFAPHIYAFLVEPLAHALEGENRRLIYTGLTEAFFTYVKLAGWTAFIFTLPLAMIQLWGFIAPGLYNHERRAFLPFLIATPVLFLLGAAMAYYFVFPIAWKFFLSYEMPLQSGGLPIEAEPRVAEYLSLVMGLIFAFGLCFELPVLLTLLAKIGLVTPQQLAKGRRYAVVVILIIAAILTPPDVISQVLLATPMYILYEISIFMARMVAPKENEQDS
ncbi:MAG: twin-arginine translocase subunit TatC [Dongiaceae bacterium]